MALKASKPSASASDVAPETVQQIPASEAADTTMPADPANAVAAGALVATASELPQDHLERMLDGGVPTFMFFHSTTCAQCVEMTGIVEQVYPDFASQVALVDVNVYDDRNQALLQAAGIRVIPTLVFFDRAGAGQGSTGVMPAEQLRAVLTDISTGAPSEP